MAKQRALQVGRWAACLVCGAGCVFFLLPLFRLGFDLGSAFGLFVCGLGLCLALTFGKLSRLGGWRQALVRLVTAFYVLGLCWAGYLTGLMFSAVGNTPPPNTNVVLLGARIYSEERMGSSLRARVDRAGEYLLENPQALVIVTGGQGPDEPCPEALTQRNALVALGVGEGRILLEDRSHNTRQNFLYAREIVQERAMGEEVAVVTQAFHMFRATQLAKAAGFSPYALVAETDPLLFPEYYGKELLSLTKWHLERLILE